MGVYVDKTMGQLVPSTDASEKQNVLIEVIEENKKAQKELLWFALHSWPNVNRIPLNVLAHQVQRSCILGLLLYILLSESGL